MTDKLARPKLILIRESAARSWIRDASTFALFVGLIGVGWLLGSEPMQWVGAIVGFITVLSQFGGFKKAATFSISEARKELDRMEANP